jgi:hypothetical protein
MIDGAVVSQELDRLITQGHQDSSLRTALQRMFPDITQAEIEAGLDRVTADRSLKLKLRQ